MQLGKLQTVWQAVNGYKTYIVSVTTILYAVISVGFGQHDWGSAVTMILGASGLGALRHGVAKSTPEPKG